MQVQKKKEPGVEVSEASFRHPIGIHVSISGKLDQSVDRAKELCCYRAFQIFTCSPRRWDASPLDPGEVAAFQSKLMGSAFQVFVHMPYLPNLSSPDGQFYSKSAKVLEREIRRCAELGIKNLVLHFGSHMNTSLESGRNRIVAACQKAIKATEDLQVRLLLENSADPKSVGSNFETIGEVLDLINDKRRLGVCLDTCHAFASGYDLSSKEAVAKSLELFDSSVGLTNLFLIHLNDSKGILGSGLDRHESIGKGRIGRAGMSAILTSDKLSSLPVVLETPRDYEGEDKENIETTKRLLKIIE
jgi:deoxyribonuclease IV